MTDSNLRVNNTAQRIAKVAALTMGLWVTGCTHPVVPAYTMEEAYYTQPMALEIAPPPVMIAQPPWAMRNAPMIMQQPPPMMVVPTGPVCGLGPSGSSRCGAYR
jgi:hypothetical protein